MTNAILKVEGQSLALVSATATVQLHIRNSQSTCLYKQLYCWETARRESRPKMAEKDVEMTN